MKPVTNTMITDLIHKAEASPRRRMNLNFHPTSSDVVQRMLVATKIDTYFRPHRHGDKSEFAIVIKGAYDVFIFDDSGKMEKKVRVGVGCDTIGFEVNGNEWHTWLPLEEDSVFFEVKKGPFDPETASEYASWAPTEGSPDVKDFLQRLQAADIGEKVWG